MDFLEVKIAQLNSICKYIVSNHHIYGVECLLRAVVRAAIKEPYITEDTLHHLIRSAYRDAREEGDNGKN